VTGTVQLTLDPGPPTQVTVAPNPVDIRADGVSTSRIRGQVQDAFGNNVANGTRVSFETTAGKIQADQPDPSDPGQKTGRTVNGVATATLTSSTTANTVATITVRALLTGAVGTAQVNFTRDRRPRSMPPPARMPLALPSPAESRTRLPLRRWSGIARVRLCPMGPR